MKTPEEIAERIVQVKRSLITSELFLEVGSYRILIASGLQSEMNLLNAAKELRADIAKILSEEMTQKE